MNFLIIFSTIVGIILIFEAIFAIYKKYDVIGWIFFIVGVLIFSASVIIITILRNRKNQNKAKTATNSANNRSNDVLFSNKTVRKNISYALVILFGIEIVFALIFHIKMKIEHPYSSVNVKNVFKKHSNLFPNRTILTTIKLTNTMTLEIFCEKLALNPWGSATKLSENLGNMSDVFSHQLESIFIIAVNQLDMKNVEEKLTLKKNEKNNIIQYLKFRFDEFKIKQVNKQIFFEHFVFWFIELIMVNEAIYTNNTPATTIFAIYRHIFKKKKQKDQKKLIEELWKVTSAQINKISPQSNQMLDIETIGLNLSFEIIKEMMTIFTNAVYVTTQQRIISPQFQIMISHWFLAQCSFYANMNYWIDKAKTKINPNRWINENNVQTIFMLFFDNLTTNTMLFYANIKNK